jgi:hypothetical protein
VLCTVTLLTVIHRDIAKISAPNEIFVNPNQTLNDLSRTSVSLWLALLIYPSLLGMSIPMLYQVLRSFYTTLNCSVCIVSALESYFCARNDMYDTLCYCIFQIAVYSRSMKQSQCLQCYATATIRPIELL